jgi:aspartyl/asparaginyl beta-hydroxylase (cupin superfamily)
MSASSVVQFPYETQQKPRGNTTKVVVGTIVIVCISLIVTLFVLAEEDRTFGHDDVEYRMDYYTFYPGRVFLGAYNTVVRKNHDCPSAPDLDTYFPEHKLFRDNFAKIREEALAVYKTENIPAFHEVDDCFETISNSKWKTFIQRWYNGNLEGNCKKTPFTCKLLESMPNVYASMLSIIEPGMFIPPHTGPSVGCLRYHLCLQAPKIGTAKITVNGNEFVYKEGAEFLFDDTYLHFVKHDGPPEDLARIILFVDVLRPLPGRWGKINKFLNDNGKFTDFVNNINSKAEVKEKLPE